MLNDVSLNIWCRSLPFSNGFSDQLDLPIFVSIAQTKPNQLATKTFILLPFF